MARRTITVRLDGELLAEIDEVRGAVPREAWMRSVPADALLVPEGRIVSTVEPLAGDADRAEMFRRATQ